MRREKFTASKISSYQCEAGKGQSIYWDSVSTNLGLRVIKAGSKAYVFESSLNGKTIRITIGSPQTWMIDAARKESAKLKTMIDQGIDPRQSKKTLIEEQETKRQSELEKQQRESLLVLAAWQAYLTHHQNRWGERHMKDHVNLSQPGGEPKKRGQGLTVQGVLYPLLQMRMVDITTDVLREWQNEEAQTRANNARQGYEMFRAFWRWCAERKEYCHIIDASVVESRDLRAEVPRRNAKPFDVLQLGQLTDWFEAVRSLQNPVISTYLQALLLTGARREEMSELRWSDVDFKWSSMWIKDKVSGKDQTKGEGRMIPLPPYLAFLLSNLPRRNEWVYSSPISVSGRMMEPARAHSRALEMAGLHHVSIHGLRRTFSSLAEWVEMPKGIVNQIMGHAPNATAEKHYIHRPLELLAIHHKRYEAWILENAGIVFDYDPGQERLRVVQ